MEALDRPELCLEIIDETTNKIKEIQERLRIANERATAYVNYRRRDLEFEIGDKVWLKVAPTKGIIRFRKRSKLASRYIGPYEILVRVAR